MSEEQREQKLAEELVRQEYVTREELEAAQERAAASGTPWLRHLLQGKKIGFGSLDNILRYEFHSRTDRAEHETLGAKLVELDLITEEQLAKALVEQKRNGRLLGNILLEHGWATRRTLGIALAKQHKMTYVDLSEEASDPEALQAVDPNLARKYQMIPLHLEDNKLTVVVTNPRAVSSLGDVSLLINKRIQPLLTSCEDVRKEITLRYKALKSGKPAKDLPKSTEPKKKQRAPTAQPEPKKPGKKSAKQATEKEEQTVAENMESSDGVLETQGGLRFEEIAREASGAPVIKLVSTIIEGAANSGATDIHLDPQDPEMRVRYRIDGVLHDVMSIAPEIEPAVVSRIKIMSDLDITETRHPQDGHIALEFGDMEYDIRVATLPTFLGERVVLRMLDQSSVLAGIKDLGMEKEDENSVMRLLKQPYGMILVTGPTGSGKTTTLYASLNQKNVVTDSIVTLEDPVEYQMSGINQVQIDTDIDVTFANTLRAALRQDIDVLLVGEVRDAETARIAIRAAMTGHLVFSTLHTNDAPEAISTLRNMDIPSYLISSALTAIIAQRLVRKICPKCKTSFTPDKTLLKSLRLPESTKRLYRGKGCDYCYHTGNKGRTGIFELLEITPTIRRMIAADEPTEKIAKSAKLKTMADRCRQKLRDGIVAPEAFLRVIRT